MKIAEQRICAYLRQTQPTKPTQPQTAQMQQFVEDRITKYEKEIVIPR